MCDDSDADGFVDAADNCPTVANPDQLNSDRVQVTAWARSWFDEIEPGVGIQVGGSSRGGPLTGVGLQFSCGTCAEATFDDAVSMIGQSQDLCGYAYQIPRQIVQNDDRLCARILSSGRTFEMDLLSFRGHGDCVDADGGASCAAVGGATSYRRTGDGVGDACEPVNVAIDIKPESGRNPINPLARGVIPVAILGSDTFDVAEVDMTTLAFGPDGATPAHRSSGHSEDVNADRLPDLVTHFHTEETGIAFGDMVACLRGETLEGVPFGGCDSVRTVPDMDGDGLLDEEEATLGTSALSTRSHIYDDV